MSDPQFPPAFLRPEDAAAYIGISRRSLTAWTRQGWISCARMGKRCTLYSRRELEAAIEKRMSGTVRK